MQLGPDADTRRTFERTYKTECCRSQLPAATAKFDGIEPRLTRWRRPEPQAGAKKLLRRREHLRQSLERPSGNVRGKREGYYGSDIVYGETVLPVRERKMLQFGSANRRAVACRMANIQAASRTPRSRERIVEKEKSQEQTGPRPPAKCGGIVTAVGKQMHSGLSYDDSRTARQGQGDACGMLLGFSREGKRDRCQGCTGPQGRTLGEDQARSVWQSGFTSE
jgi:hypothetical protein